MLGFVIGDNDMITGFRLVGVEGTEVTSVEGARAALKQALQRRDLAVVLLGEDFSAEMRGEIDRIRSQQIKPLIVEIPSRKGPSSETRMSTLISRTLGIRL